MITNLHEFEVLNRRPGCFKRIGQEDDDFDVLDEGPLVPEKKAKLSDYFTLENKAALYRYDFGDNWQVKIRLEKILQRKAGVEYPICTAGKKSGCPRRQRWGRTIYVYAGYPEGPFASEYEDTIEDWGRS